MLLLSLIATAVATPCTRTVYDYEGYGVRMETSLFVSRNASSPSGSTAAAPDTEILVVDIATAGCGAVDIHGFQIFLDITDTRMTGWWAGIGGLDVYDGGVFVGQMYGVACASPPADPKKAYCTIDGIRPTATIPAVRTTHDFSFQLNTTGAFFDPADSIKVRLARVIYSDYTGATITVARHIGSYTLTP